MADPAPQLLYETLKLIFRDLGEPVSGRYVAQPGGGRKREYPPKDELIARLHAKFAAWRVASEGAGVPVATNLSEPASLDLGVAIVAQVNGFGARASSRPSSRLCLSWYSTMVLDVASARARVDFHCARAQRP